MSEASSASRRRSVSLFTGGGLTVLVLSGTGAPISGALAVESPTVTMPSGATSTGAATTPAETSPASTGTTSTSTTPSSPAPTVSTQTGTAPAPTPSPKPSGQAGGGSQSGNDTGSRRPHAVSRAHRAPKATVQHSQQTTSTPATSTGQSPSTQAPAPANAPPAAPASSTAIAPAPQLAAVQSSALAAMMRGSTASLQALDFYRIPPFLLPIYQAAAVQYGVPWQVLAAINEVETDFGTDLSVSTAGAVGWMQFMPETWLQYGVDALDAGYADPYNPVDAIFAAARYLHAAGASSDLHAAILAYNHSEAYVESVLLRARLFASYPGSAIATLTGLIEGTPPVAGARVVAVPASEAPAPPAATGAAGVSAPSPAAAQGGGQADTSPPTASATPSGPSPAPSPRASGASARRPFDAAAPAKQLSALVAKKKAPVLAVEDGRIVGVGVSRKLGDYVVLRDTYGDVFTYAGLGTVAPDYRLAKPKQLQVPKGALPSGEAGGEPVPSQAATAGSQPPVTLHVAARQASPAPRPPARSVGGEGAEGEGGGGKIRVFAHPGNPDARLAGRRRADAAQERALAPGWAVLARGALVAQGTVLGQLAGGDGRDASLRFAIRPAGAQSAIDPGPILENWRQLSAALHPRGARAQARSQVLAGATAADAFTLSRAELERAALADPGIQMGACDRMQVAAGKVDRRLLAMLVFLSRSGLKPTVGQLRCGSEVQTGRGAAVVFPAAGTLDIAAVNGVPIAGHQGAGTVTDLTVRTLLTVKRHYAPRRIVSLMSYPGAPSTVAAGDHASFIGLEFGPAARRPAARRSVAAGTPAGGASAARAGRVSQTAPSAALSLDTLEWQHLIGQIATIQQPRLVASPSASAIRDARP